LVFQNGLRGALNPQEVRGDYQTGAGSISQTKGLQRFLARRISIAVMREQAEAIRLREEKSELISEQERAFKNAVFEFAKREDARAPQRHSRSTKECFPIAAPRRKGERGREINRLRMLAYAALQDTQTPEWAAREELVMAEAMERRRRVEARIKAGS
jgi:hypothetical protein